MSQTVELKSFTEEEERLIRREYDLLIEDYLKSNHRRKTELIDRAFALAHKGHYGVRRRSGEPYIFHPIAVAKIVCHEIGLGSTSICCALLHDVVEDTEYTVEDLRDMFGDKIAQIVDGLTKISGNAFSSNTSIQAENFRKLILTMNDDVRVILIKIADRLHNMRTLSSMLPAKQYKIAGETLYVYAPLAHRLGLFAIKSELEDLSFRYEYPDVYNSLLRSIEASAAQREELFEAFAKPLRQRFAEMGINYEMKSRLKSIFSIWRKMEKKHIPIDEVYDLYAVRIIFESDTVYPDKNRCWDIYTAITDIYKNRSDRIRDWVSNPKSNGYQALHLTVMGPGGNWIEVQIRSRKMDDIAEKGFAAHWKYKEDGVEEDSELEKWLSTIREILENPTPNAMDFLDTIKLNLYSSDIMVFTPKGDSMKIPTGASVLDFAYAIHTDLGDHCIGAKVNHKIVPPSHILNSGDQVEILDSQKARPSEDALKYVVTAKAKYQIDLAIRKQNKIYIKEGEEIVRTCLEKDNKKVNHAIFNRIASFYGFDKKEDFFLGVGNGSVNLSQDLEKILTEKNPTPNFISRMLSSVFGSKVKSSKDYSNKDDAYKIDKKKPYELRNVKFIPNYTIAGCCHPIPGDDVIGILTDNNKVEVHRRSCLSAIRLKSSMGDRILETYWGDTTGSTFNTTLVFKGVDSLGILTAICTTFTQDFKINIKELTIQTKDSLFEGKIVIVIHNLDEVNKVCQQLQKDKIVLSIMREVD